MADRLKGKCALITGAASGLGATMARMFADEGAKVVLTDIQLEQAHDVARQINADHGDVALALKHDVRDEADWQAVIVQAASFMKGLNVLVNNAGIGATANLEEMELAEWRRVQEIDVDSVFLGCKHALKVMREHAPGSIINISSIAAMCAGYNLAAYNAAKAAVLMLSKSVAMHCTRYRLDIRSNSIHPAFIRTPILHGFASVDQEALERKLAAQIPMGRIGDPEDVGYAAIYLASDESKFVTGSEFKVDGGLSAQ